MKKHKPLGLSKAVASERVLSTEQDVQADLVRLVGGLNELERVVDKSRGPFDPRVYTGHMIFEPEPTSFALDTAQSNAGTSLVNAILRSGQEYRVPVAVGGDERFNCLGVRATFLQRFFNNQTGVGKVVQLQMAPHLIQFDTTANGLTTPVSWTTKFSLWKAQPEQGDHAASPPSVMAPMLNYVWNVLDDTGWTYADQMLPLTSMLPKTLQAPFSINTFNGADGGRHRFSSPIEIEQAQTLIFVFRPLTDVFQFDSSISGTSAGLGFDDREGGKRNQAVTCKVEFFGEAVGR